VFLLSVAVLEENVAKEMAEATPALEAAVAALDTIKSTDITLVKAMKNPPQAVKTVMEAICIMRSIIPENKTDGATGKKYKDYWTPSQKLLSDIKFIDALKTYDKKNIPPEVIAKIRKEYVL
jgi:dynein heavy chain